MKISSEGSRLRVPADEAYLLSLGRAVFIFARLEWQVAWCWELKQPSSLQSIIKMTAKVTAGKFLEIVENEPHSHEREILLPLAERFYFLADKRNGLIHVQPGTLPNGDQALFRHGSPWSIADIDTFADDCAQCASELNDFFFRYLQPASTT